MRPRTFAGSTAPRSSLAPRRGWHPGHAVLLLLALVAIQLTFRAVHTLGEAPPASPLPPLPAGTADPESAATDPFFPAAADTGDAPVTALSFSLHGLRNEAASGRGSAIIAGEDGVQKVYAVGEAIGDGVTLAAIAGDHVLLDHDGVRESLWLAYGSDGDVERYDPLAYEPMPLPDADDAETLAPSDAPAPAAGAAVLPATPANPRNPE